MGRGENDAGWEETGAWDDESGRGSGGGMKKRMCAISQAL